MKHRGFTLVETLIVIAVIGILAALAFSYVKDAKERTYETRAKAELGTLATALKLYVAKYNTYPPDAPEAGIPSDIKEFIAPGNYVSSWPNGPWPGSLYDYDAYDVVKPGPGPDTWVVGQDGVDDTWQVSVRWCTYAEYVADPQICKKRFPKTDWAKDFVTNDSSMYWCVKGYCRPNGHEETWDFPGFCLNCGTPDNKGIQAPDGN